MEHYHCDFDALAETYDRWYDTAEGAMYDHLEKQAVAEHISEKARGKKLLEIGSGTGHWSQFFSNMGYIVSGVDVSPRMVNIAEGKRMTGVSFGIADAHDLPFDDGVFDITAAITTLEFVRDPGRVLHEMVRCTKKSGGKIIIGALNCCAAVNRRRRNNRPYSMAHYFSSRQLRHLLEPYGNPYVRSTAFVPAMHHLLFLAPALTSISRKLYLPNGAFLVGVVAL